MDNVYVCMDWKMCFVSTEKSYNHSVTHLIIVPFKQVINMRCGIDQTGLKCPAQVTWISLSSQDGVAVMLTPSWVHSWWSVWGASWRSASVWWGQTQSKRWRWRWLLAGPFPWVPVWRHRCYLVNGRHAWWGRRRVSPVWPASRTEYDVLRSAPAPPGVRRKENRGVKWDWRTTGKKLEHIKASTDNFLLIYRLVQRQYSEVFNTPVLLINVHTQSVSCGDLSGL